MPDDQNQKPIDTAQGKSSTIDDLVKELSKNPNPNQPPPLSATASQGPPPNLPGIKLPADHPRPDIAVGVEPERQVGPVSPPSRPTSPPTNIPRPSPSPSGPVSAPQRPVPTPSRILDKAGTTPGAGSPVQEYRSSIRTMGEDITSIKSGQKPSGVDVPRRVTPEAPKASLPGAPKPEAPAGPRQIIGLGQAEKGGALPGISRPKPPTPSDQKQVGLGQAEKTTGSLPGIPTPPKPAGPLKPPGIQPSVTVPSEKKGISTMFYLLIAGILVVGGFLYWFFVMRAPAPEVVITPTPTPTVTPTPVVRDLNDIFVGTPVNFEVVLSDDVSGDFKTFVNTLTIAGGEFLKVNLVRDVDGTLVPLNWLDMFDMDLTVYPSGLRNNAADLAVLVYGQTEMFNEDGTSTFNAQDLKRTALVARVSNAAAVKTMMMDWELTLADDLADYLLIDDTSKEESVNFLDNAYRGVSIRYKNFPFPDVTIDYALVEAAGQGYLVIAGSREAVYAAIDVLLEQ